MATECGRLGIRIACALALLLFTSVLEAGPGFEACCLPDGMCVDLPVNLCLSDSISGEPQGAGSTCPSACVPFGGCCLLDLVCVDVIASECAPLGGEYQGDGEVCSDSICPVRGACCLPNESCVEGVTHDDCGAIGGLYMGFSTTCGAVSCAAPDVEPNEELQCITFSRSQNTEFFLPFDRFDPMGGARRLTKASFEFNGQTVAYTTLRNTGTNPLVTLTEVTELLTMFVPGIPLLVAVDSNDFIECGPGFLLPPQETCDFGGPMSEGGGMMQMTDDPDDLLLYIGTSPISANVTGVGIFTFSGSQFIFTQAPHMIEGTLKVRYEFGLTGACCFDDNSCVLATEPECADADGIFQGIGTPCVAGVCPLQKVACCMNAGVCVDMTPENCTLQGGISQGAGSVCLLADCAGACCYIGTSTCAYITPNRCNATGGFYAGDGVFCAGSVCPSVSGACCLSDLSCIITTSVACAVTHDGTFGGENSTCGKACPAAFTACCRGDATCAMMDAAACTDDGGQSLSQANCDGAVCAPACPGDVDGSGAVEFGDILLVLGAWGSCPGPCGPVDVDGSGDIGFGDVLMLLGAWGQCE